MGQSSVGIGGHPTDSTKVAAIGTDNTDTGQEALYVRDLSSGGGGGGVVTQGTVPWVTNDPGLPDTLGQKVKAGSTSVTIASDQTAVSVDLNSVSGAFLNVGNGTAGTGTLRVVLASDQTSLSNPIPISVADGSDVAQGTTTDAATANTVIGRLKKLVSLLPAALGQTTMAASLPVVISSDQSAVVVNDPGLPDTLGQKTMANSTGVVIASDQTAVAVTATALTDGTQKTQLVDGGGDIADVITGDTGNNGVVVVAARKEVSFSTGSNIVVASTDVSNFAWVSVQFTSVGSSGVVSFQTSNDNTNWVGMSMQSVLGGTAGDGTSLGGPQATKTTAGIVQGPVTGRYFRLSIASVVSGTTAGVVEFMSVPKSPIYHGVVAVQSGTWTMGQSGTWTVNLGGAAAALTDSITNPTATQVGAANELFDGTTFFRQRGNVSGPVVAAGTTSTQTNVAVTNYNGRGLIIVVNITAGAGTVAVAINGSTATAYTYNLLTSTALVGAGSTALRVFPAATPSANAVANDVIPRDLKITATVVGSITYGIDYILTV